MNNRKTVVSCTLTPVDEETSKAEVRLEATLVTMLEAFEHLSVAVINQLEEEKGVEFAEAMYAVMQMKVIEQTCLNKGFKEKERELKQAMALSSILGKTFTMPEKEEE